MNSIHARSLRYRLVFVTADGGHIDASRVASALTLEDQAGQLAQHVTWTLQNVKYGSGYLSDAIPLCTLTLLYADWGAGLQEVFRGPVWDWDSVNETSKTFSGGAYDNLIYLQKSKDNLYYSVGMGTEHVVSSICSKWNVPLVYSYGSIAHAALAYKSQYISEAILGTLNAAKAKLGYGYSARSTQGTFYVQKKGVNTDIPMFTNLNVTSSEHRLTLDNLVTKVLVTQSNSYDKQDAVVATVYGKTQYGVLQEIVSLDTSSSDSARTQGQNILNENGTPTEDITLNSAVDVPFLRRGDKVQVNAGTLAGNFYVTGITHNAVAGSMQATLERAA